MLTKDKFEDVEYIKIIKRYMCSNGFNGDAYKPSYLQRRILVRLRANQVESFGKYYRILKKDPKEYRELLDALTINVTKFFRDPDVYQALSKQIIPDLQAIKNPGSTIRIWSAGCASGEEPYSIAMVILEALGGNQDNYKLSIHATDIDERILKVARDGNYNPKKLVKIPQHLIHKYFVFNRGYQVSRDLRDRVSFRKSDLLTDSGIRFCDLIFCRNVLIYLNRDDQEEIMRLFYKNLQPDGVLILGKTESLLPGLSSLFLCIDRRAHIYRKI